MTEVTIQVKVSRLIWTLFIMFVRLGMPAFHTLPIFSISNQK